MDLYCSMVVKRGRDVSVSPCPLVFACFVTRFCIFVRLLAQRFRAEAALLAQAAPSWTRVLRSLQASSPRDARALEHPGLSVCSATLLSGNVLSATEWVLPDGMPPVRRCDPGAVPALLFAASRRCDRTGRFHCVFELSRCLFLCCVSQLPSASTH